MVCTLVVLAVLIGYGEEGKVPVALVGDRTITSEELREAVGKLPRKLQFPGGGVVKWRKCLDILINKELILMEAYDRGLDRDEKVLEALEEAKRELMLRELYNRRVLAEVEVTDEEARKFYEEKGLNESVRISQISVDTEREAERILKELETGRSFEELAKGRPKGGDMGWVFRGDLPPALEKVVFSTKVGRVSGPVKMGNEYIIVKVADRRRVKFEDIKDDIKERLRPLKEKELKGKDREILRREYHIKFAEGALDLLAGRRKEDLDKLPDSEKKKVLISSDVGKITLKDYLKALEDTPFWERPAPDDTSSLKGFLEYILLSRVVLPYDARKAGLDTCSAVLRELEKRKHELMAERLRELEAVDKIKITPEEVEAYFKAHRRDFVEPPRAEVVDIHLKDKDKADSLLALIRRGVDIEELAEKHSTLKRPGRLRWKFPVVKDEICENIFGKEFMDAVFGAKVGEVVGPIKVKGGYAIFKVLERREARPRSLEEVKKQVVSALRREKEGKLFGELLEKLRRKYRVVVYEDVLKEMATQK